VVVVRACGAAAWWLRELATGGRARPRATGGSGAVAA
jgi:hypothetical protein